MCVDGRCAASPCPSGDGDLIGPDGGTITHGRATLSIPAGALPESTLVCMDDASGPPPEGYTAYSPRYELSPAGLIFATPAALTVTLDAPPAHGPAGFVSRTGSGRFDWLGASVDGLTVTTRIPHFSEAFIGDGEVFVDPPDTSCALTRLLDGRAVPPSGVALFVTADDCHGTPLTALDPGAFRIYEDGEPLTSESAEITATHEGVTAFVTLVFDMSSSTADVIPELIAAARAFVTHLSEGGGPAPRISVELFSGAERSDVWTRFQLDPATVLERLDALADYVAPDPASTNLHGALVAALDRSREAQEAYRERQAGGAFTVGHVVVFTDGRDTAGRVDEATATSRAALSGYEVVGVGLARGDYDADALARLAPGGVFSALTGDGLETAFLALANRIERQAARSYAIFFCSPERVGFHAASVRIADAEMVEQATFAFDSNGFGPGCAATQLAEACEGRVCGGLGCGGCDERREVCEPGSGACVDACSAVCDAPGTITNPAGVEQECVAECDSDWVGVADDNCPFADNPEQLDSDGDGDGDACDPDLDDDGRPNEEDACSPGLTGWASGPTTDHDADGCRDADEDDDDDDDAVLDDIDACATGEVGWGAAAETDHDGDGCRDDGEDEDDDGDGVLDDGDRCPRGDTTWVQDADNDRDHDGCRDIGEDVDRDNDGVLDADDQCDYGANTWTSTPETDNDGDGCRDGGFDNDDDNDGILDEDDRCPLSAAGWVSSASKDHDQDGCQDDGEDADDDNDGVADEVDSCPKGAVGWTSNDLTDRDGDGCRSSDEDLDDDNDGRRDTYDYCPEGEIGWTSSGATDHDADGCRDAGEDADDDHDGMADDVDPCPLGYTGAMSTYSDHDQDGCHDTYEDDDDDNDGIADAADRCRAGELGWVPSPEADRDGDGCRDATEDTDDDGDGTSDATDSCPQGLLGWTSTTTTDHDRDGCNDAVEDDDDDNDGFPDDDDACPSGAYGWEAGGALDYDSDGCRDSYTEDRDDDNDGATDNADGCAKGLLGWTSSPETDHDHDGCNDAAEDEDDDNDGYADDVDACPAGHVGVAEDADADGCADIEEVDADGDGVPEAVDPCPFLIVPGVLDSDHDGCPDGYSPGDLDGDGVADNDHVCVGYDPCVCGAENLCVVGDFEVLPRRIGEGWLQSAAFGPGDTICRVEAYTPPDGTMSVTVSLLGADGTVQWSKPIAPGLHPAPDTFTSYRNVPLRPPLLVPYQTNAAAACVVLLDTRFEGTFGDPPQVSTTTQAEVYAFDTNGQLKLSTPVGTGVTWMRINTYDSFSVRPPGLGETEWHITRRRANGNLEWEDAITTTGMTDVTFTMGFGDNSISGYVGGTAKVGSQQRAIVARYSSTSGLTWVKTLGGSSCAASVAEIEPETSSRIRVSGPGILSATINNGTVVGVLEDCTPAVDSRRLPEGCRASIRGAAGGAPSVMSVDLVGLDGPLAVGLHAHGEALPVGRALRVTDIAVHVLAERVASASWAHVVLTPCGLPAECDDQDVCTEDTAVAPGVCTTTFAPSPSCGYCSAASCDDADPCTTDTCAPYDSGCTHAPVSCP